MQVGENKNSFKFFVKVESYGETYFITKKAIDNGIYVTNLGSHFCASWSARRLPHVDLPVFSVVGFATEVGSSVAQVDIYTQQSVVVSPPEIQTKFNVN